MSRAESNYNVAFMENAPLDITERNIRVFENFSMGVQAQKASCDERLDANPCEKYSLATCCLLSSATCCASALIPWLAMCVKMPSVLAPLAKIGGFSVLEPIPAGFMCGFSCSLFNRPNTPAVLGVERVESTTSNNVAYGTVVSSPSSQPTMS